MDGSGGAKFKKSILPHVILRELHSDIELMLTNCRRSEKNVRSGSDKEDSDKLVDVESSDNVGNVVKNEDDDERRGVTENGAEHVSAASSEIPDDEICTCSHQVSPGRIMKIIFSDNFF